jgi:DNA-binding transcriptional MocR family regulator
VGRLIPGSRLPTVRQVAADLGVSPATVAAAWQRLRLRGIVSSEGRRGTHVGHRPPLSSRRTERPVEGARDLASGNPDPELLPDIDAAIGSIDIGQPLYGQTMNSVALLDLGRSHFLADGITCDNIAIVGGALDGIERILAAHLSPGDVVAVEDPGFTRVLDLVSAMGLVAVPVRIDSFGLLPNELDASLTGRTRALILTPRAQNPTGAALDESRLRELRTILEKYPRLLVIEDDHAAAASGVPALSVTADREVWAVVRSVSKTLGPDLRLAFLAGDPVTVGRVEGRQLLGTGWVSHILQSAVARLAGDREVGNLLERASQTYSQRRATLVNELRRCGFDVEARSGYNVWIPVPDEGHVVGALASLGWAVARGEPFRLRSEPGIRVTAATLTTAESKRFATDLATSLEPTALRTYA